MFVLSTEITQAMIFPCHELLDPNWVLYRWFQARVIACLDFVARYGFSNSKFSQKKLENDYLHDTEYLTFAPLAGSRDPG
jgi:hypothetical protein